MPPTSNGTAQKRRLGPDGMMQLYFLVASRHFSPSRVHSIFQTRLLSTANLYVLLARPPGQLGLKRATGSTRCRRQLASDAASWRSHDFAFYCCLPQFESRDMLEAEAAMRCQITQAERLPPPLPPPRETRLISADPTAQLGTSSERKSRLPLAPLAQIQEEASAT